MFIQIVFCQDTELYKNLGEELWDKNMLIFLYRCLRRIHSEDEAVRSWIYEFFAEGELRRSSARDHQTKEETVISSFFVFSIYL